MVWSARVSCLVRPGGGESSIRILCSPPSSSCAMASFQGAPLCAGRARTRGRWRPPAWRSTSEGACPLELAAWAGRLRAAHCACVCVGGGGAHRAPLPTPANQMGLLPTQLWLQRSTRRWGREMLPRFALSEGACPLELAAWAGRLRAAHCACVCVGGGGAHRAPLPTPANQMGLLPTQLWLQRSTRRWGREMLP